MRTESHRPNHSPREKEHISLCETLDRVLTKGVVITGEVVISVADIDLIYLGLRLVLTSVETARQARLTLKPGIGVQAGARA